MRIDLDLWRASVIESPCMCPAVSESVDTVYNVVQVFAIPGGAQAKVEDMSRALLSHVSQIPGKSFFQQVTSGSNQPLADFGKKLAVSMQPQQIFTHLRIRWNYKYKVKTHFFATLFTVCLL